MTKQHPPPTTITPTMNTHPTQGVCLLGKGSTDMIVCIPDYLLLNDDDALKNFRSKLLLCYEKLQREEVRGREENGGG